MSRDQDAADGSALAVTVAADGALRFEVRAKPRSSRPGLGPVREGRLEARLGAAPVEDAANEELVRRVAKALGVAGSRVRIVAGEHARTKRVEVLDVEAAALATLRWIEPG